MSNFPKVTSDSKQSMLPSKTRGRRRNAYNTNARGFKILMNDMNLISVNRSPVFPLRKRVWLPYQETVSLLSGASAANTYVFSANGLYDPNITGTGHQPSGFDQMMAFYRHYTVHACRCSVHVRPATAAYGGTFGLSARSDNTTVINISQLIEDGFIVYKPLATPATSDIIQKFSLLVDVGKFEGIDDVLDSSILRGDVASNPAEQAYIHLSYWNENDATQILAYLSVFLEYDVTFTEPRPLTQS